MSLRVFRPARPLAAVLVAVGLLVADVGTGAALRPAEASSSPTLSYGSRGDSVRWVQRVLHVRPVSGWYGPITRSAVTRHQRRHHLRSTGVVGRRTWRSLRAMHARAVHRARASRSASRSGLPSRITSLNWRALASCESGNNPRAVNPAGYYGLFQFDVRTWRSVGGRGYPHRAGRGEQTYRAQKLYRQRGSSPWPVCGRRLYS